MELPLTETCPQCGAEMEPRKAVRRGRVVYVCPECGYQMEISDAGSGRTAEADTGNDYENAHEKDEEDEDEDEGDEEHPNR